jgi:hypothetical protein
MSADAPIDEVDAAAKPEPMVQDADKSKAEAVIQTRSADTHSHGAATFAIALDGSVITAELDTPLYNVLGFEHAAETDAQKSAVRDAEAVLSKADSVVVFNREAGCTADEETISVELGGHDLEEDDDHDEDHKDHDAHDDHDDHETHRDLRLQYKFTCSDPKALKHVTVNLFDHFENLSDLELVYLGPNTQTQDMLSKDKTRMDLTP